MEYETIGKFLFPPEIRKPMSVQPTYDYVRIRKRYFDVAKKGKYLVVVRTPNGERIMRPEEVKKMKVVKETFLFPDRPMEMYDITVPKCEKKPREYFIGHN